MNIVICSKKTKNDFLKKNTESKKLENVKYYTLDEFKKSYFGTYKEEAIYYLMKKNNYKYDVAKTYLDNYYFLDDLKTELEDKNLLVKENIKIDKIKIVNCYKIDPFILNEIKKYDYEIVEENDELLSNKVYEFDTMEEEVNFVILKILELLKTVDINDIFLVNVGSEYKITIKKLFKFYDIPVNFDNEKLIYGTKTVQKFLQNLKNSKEFVIENNEISEQIVNIVNRYRFTEIDDAIIECIDSELKHTYLKSEKIKNAISIVDIEDIENEKYYFVLGFNDGVLPKVIKDEDYFNDSKKHKLGLLTTLEKNKINSDLTYKKISKKNVVVTYNIDKKYPSNLIKEKKLEVIKEKVNNYNSDIYNKLVLARELDDLIKYNIKYSDLNLLYSNYKNINYSKYDNKYTKIDKDKFYDYIKSLTLSYSSLNNYYKCSFRYYLNNILRINKNEETFDMYIGKLFHHILEIYKSEDFNFDEEFNKFISAKTFNKREAFFINKLKKDLLYIMDVINKFDSYSSLDKEFNEKEVIINKDRNIKITFKGTIDKIKYKEVDNKNYVVVIDYKTGTADSKIDNAKYGLNMQLPMYLYLTVNSDLKNVEFIGFYVQKIRNSEIKYTNDYEHTKEKKYYLDGYSINNKDILELFDKTYMDSMMIKSLKVTNSGSFHSNSKTISKEKIDDLIKLTETKIDEAIDNILDCKFDIDPKFSDKIDSCKYCEFSDICFRKEEDKVHLEDK